MMALQTIKVQCTSEYRVFLAELRQAIDPKGIDLAKGEAALIGYCVACVAGMYDEVDSVPRCPPRGGSKPGLRGKRGRPKKVQAE